MSASAERSELLIRALRAFYFAMGSFALATLLSLLGLAMETFDPLGLVRPLEILALAAGVFAFGGLVTGAVQTPARNPPRRPPVGHPLPQPPRQSRGMGTPHCSVS